MRYNLTIAAKLAIAYGLFLAPIAYLGYQMVADKEANIAFAAKESLGVQYIADVRSVQDAVVRGADMAGLVERIKTNEKARGDDLKTAKATDALLKALAGTDRAAAAQAAADLVGKAADGSNLTLDPDLDSFVGALQPTLDGLASDIDSAVQGNPDKTVDGAVTAAVGKVTETSKAVLASLTDHDKAADAQTVALPLLDAITAAGAADAGEVEHLLNARISGFRPAEMTSGAVASALFLAAVFYVLVVVQRGAISPLRALTNTMRKLADHDLSTEVGGQRT